MKRIKYTYLTLLIVMLLTGCGSSTSITGSYKAPESASKSYDKIFVAALTDRAYAKQKVETSISNYLTSQGIATIKSIDALPPNFKAGTNTDDKALVLQKIREKDCDGILTIALIDQQHETRYVPGTAYYPTTYPYYGAFSSYYAYGYNSFYSPGYYTDDKIYYMEANLYDSQSEKLIWSAQSKTYNPSSIDSFLEDYVQALSQQMSKDGIIKAVSK